MTGKDYFDKFLKSTNSASSTTTPIKCAKEGVNLTIQEIANTTPVSQSTLNTLLPGSSIPYMVSNHIDFIRNFDKISLWNTRILKTVVPTKMVWAPYYRFRNKKFCARLCENDEIERDPYIKTPLSDGECVVEFICAPKTEKEDTRLLKVYTKDIIPFYGKSMGDLPKDSSPEWCSKLVDKMHQAIKEKCNKIDTEHIFNSIITAAREYLKEALGFEKAMKLALAKQQSPQRSILLSSDSSNNYKHRVVSSPVGESWLAPPSGGDTHTCHSLDHQPETLEIGDFIRYASEIQNDVLVYARITGFSNDFAAPLLLSNHAQLPLKKRICKMTKVPLSENSLGYDPKSGKYRTLRDFQLLHPPAAFDDADSPGKDTGSRNQVKRAITEEEDHDVVTPSKMNNMKTKNIVIRSQDTLGIDNLISPSSKKRKTPTKAIVAKTGTHSTEGDDGSLDLLVDSPPLMPLPSSQRSPLCRQQQSIVSSSTNYHPSGNNASQSSPRGRKSMKTDSSSIDHCIGSSDCKFRSPPSAMLDKSEGYSSTGNVPTRRSSRANTGSAKKASPKYI